MWLEIFCDKYLMYAGMLDRQTSIYTALEPESMFMGKLVKIMFIYKVHEYPIHFGFILQQLLIFHSFTYIQSAQCCRFFGGQIRAYKINCITVEQCLRVVWGAGLPCVMNHYQSFLILTIITAFICSQLLVFLLSFILIHFPFPNMEIPQSRNNILNNTFE